MVKSGYGTLHGANVTADVIKAHKDDWCEGCALQDARVGKAGHRHRRRRHQQRSRRSKPNELHGVDTSGRTTPSYQKNKYTTIIVDHHDGATWAYSHRRMKDTSAILRLHEHHALVDARLTRAYESNGHVDLPLKAYRCDNGGEHSADIEQSRRREHGIATQFTVPGPGHGQQNGAAERRIRAVRDLRIKLIHGGLHPVPIQMARRLWDWADRHAAMLITIKPGRQYNPGDRSPAHIRYAAGQGARDRRWVERLTHVWLSAVVVVRHEADAPARDKNEPRGEIRYFLGVPDLFRPGYICWDMERPTAKPLVFQNVQFVDHNSGFDLPSSSKSRGSTRGDARVKVETTKLSRGDARGNDGLRGDARDKPTSKSSNGDAASSDAENQDDSDVGQPRLRDAPLGDGLEERTEWPVQVGDVVDRANERMLARMEGLESPRKFITDEDGTTLMLWDDDSDEESVHHTRAKAGVGDLLTTMGDMDVAITAGSNDESGDGSTYALNFLSGSDSDVDLLSDGGEEEHEIDMDDGWAGKFYLPRGEHADGPTLRLCYNRLRRGRDLGFSLSDMRRHNGSNPANSRFQPVNEDGSRRFVWIPTDLGTVDGEVVAPSTSSSAASEQEEHDVVVSLSDNDGDDGAEAPVDSNGATSAPVASGSVKVEEEKEPERPTSPTISPTSPDQRAAAAQVAHNTRVIGTFRRNREEELRRIYSQHANSAWFRRATTTVQTNRDSLRSDLDMSDGLAVGHMLRTSMQHAVLSVKASGKHQQRHYNASFACFEIAHNLSSIQVANAVKGLEGVRARDVPEPSSYKKAVQSEHAHFWREAIVRELANLESYDIWEWCDLPPGRKCIDTTWAFKVKTNALGFIDKFKARCCARGYRQIYGLDFLETHAPVTVLSSWRACVAEAARYGMDFDIWDVSGAYLNSPLIEEIYCKPPEGLKGGKPGQVLRLKKALYGLKQAGRAWHQKFTSWLEERGFRAATADPSLFILQERVREETRIVRINVYVDDAFSTHNNTEFYEEFKRQLNDPTDGFKLSSSEDNHVFLGVSVERLHDGAIKLHQTRYVNDLVARFLPPESRDATGKIRVPHFVTLTLSKDMCPSDDDAKRAMANIPYASLIGALNHLACFTRPDISQAVGVVAQFCANPGAQHWKAAIRILEYLRDTAEYGIIYGRQRTEFVPFAPLFAYVDASWADDPDDRTSRGGYQLWSWGAPIEWRSSKQTAQALSTTEAEYMAACEAVKAVVWARRLYQMDFGYDDLSIFNPDAPATEAESKGARPVTVFEDNSGCIEWSRNPVQHQRSKHIDLKYHFVRAKVKDGEVKLVHCVTERMVADLLTKYLSARRFEFLRDIMLSDEQPVSPGRR